jgi:hypothetical protein
MRLSISILLCFAGMALMSSCSGTPPRNTYPATFHRTSLDQWETVERPDLRLSFEKPKGLRTLGSSTSILIQLHGVSGQSTFPSDTQYLITISIDVYSKTEWETRFGNLVKVDPSIEEKARNDAKVRDWLEFKKWAYSLKSEITMREYHEERYYRRAFTNDLGTIVEINTEYIPQVPEMIAGDDAAIRRIMSSVAFMAEKNEPTAIRPGNRDNPLNVSTNK